MEKPINYTTKCKTCKKSCCENCYVKICKLQNVISEKNEVIRSYCNYKCPFCTNKNIQDISELDSNVNVNIIKRLSKENFNKEENESRLNDIIEFQKKKIEQLKKRQFENEKMFNILNQITKTFLHPTDKKKTIKKKDLDDFITKLKRVYFQDELMSEVQPLF
jgi:UDP-galactopyranose mutase